MSTCTSNESEELGGEKLIAEVKRHKLIGKVLFVGNGAVGKTSLMKVLHSSKNLMELHCGPEAQEYMRTPFMNLEAIRSEEIRLQIYDLAGQKNRDLHPTELVKENVYSRVDIVILMFALNDFQSFLDLKEWFEHAHTFYQNQPWPNPAFIFVGNKSDLPPAIDDTMVYQAVQNIPEIVDYQKISTLTGDGVPELRRIICRWVIKRLTGL